MDRKNASKWLVAVVVVFNSFMFYMDATIVSVALPTLGRTFGAGPTAIGWTVTGYVVSLAMVIPLSGWLGDRLGTKRVFLLGLGMFTLGSFLCSLSWSSSTLILFRIIQGSGAGLLQPVGAAMLYRAFPPNERATAAAFAVIVTVLAPSVGPIVGGYLVQYAGWSWIFLVNLPFGAVGFVLAAVFLKETVQEAEERFDVAGFVAATVAVGASIYALQELGRHGLGSTSVLAAAAFGAVAVIVFVIRENSTANPLLDLRLLADRMFAAGTVTSFFVQALFVGSLFLLPFLLQSEKGLSAFGAGLVTFPTAIGVGMIVPFASRWYHSVGPRRLLLLSMAMSILSSVGFMFVGASTSDWVIRVLLLPRGWAFGLALVSLGAATYVGITREKMGRATALYSVGAQVGSSAGVAFLASILASGMSLHHAAVGNPNTVAGAWAAFHDAFAASVLLAVVGTAVALLVSDRLAAASMRAKGAIGSR